MEEAKRLADAGQKPAKPPKVTPVISGVQLAEALARPHFFQIGGGRMGSATSRLSLTIMVKFFRNYGIEQRTVRLPG